MTTMSWPMMMSGIYPVAMGVTLLGLAAASVAIADESTPASYDRAADRHNFTVFLNDGGWCWFQDPRMIIHDNKLFVGSVQGNGSGPVKVGIYDLRQNKSLGTATLRKQFGHDDHNCPVFYARPDGSILAVYALHGANKTHYYRISDRKNPLVWGEEGSYEHDYPNAGNVTYMNLYAMEQERKLYNFFRGIEFNPSFIVSQDRGRTWGEPTHFIKSELEGRHRPYARYTGNGIDTVHVCFTDGHPDRFGNSIYYAAFRGGKFFHANGQRIKDLKVDGPLRPSEAERVFQGGDKWAPAGPASADRSAWTSSIALDGQGHPHIAYSLHLSDADHRYRIASWDGKKWMDREVAYAGRCLYATQTSYTGLITLDPGDPSAVLISTNVDPKTGGDNGGKHEIYRAQIGLADSMKSIHWEAITKNSPVGNLRPIIVRGDNTRILAWLRGDYQTYTSYDLDVVGVIEEVSTP